MNILVICAAGMSSSALVSRMRSFVVSKGETDLKIGSCASNEADGYIPQADVVFISPHINFMMENFRATFPDKRFYLIERKDYGTQNVEHILSALDQKEPIQVVPEKETKTSRLTRITEKFACIFAKNKTIQAINSGMIAMTPITIFGSIFVLLRNFPITPFTQWLVSTGIDNYLKMGEDATIGMIALYACLMIGRELSSKSIEKPLSGGLAAVVCFMLLVLNGSEGINTTYLGPNGLFLSLFVAIISGKLLEYLSKKQHMNLKGVPEDASESIKAIIPLLVTVIPFMIISYLFSMTEYTSFPDFVMITIQMNFMRFLGNNIFTDVLLQGLACLLWFFGIHGGNVVGSFYKPILMPLSFADIAAYQAGEPLPYIINQAYRYTFTFGGVGSTLGLCILMAMKAKSKYLKQLGKISLPMGVFFINEPVLFGLPIIMNPTLIVPFFGIPVISNLLTYFVMSIGLIPRPIGFTIPWSTPILISGALQGGWQLMIWQVLILVLQIAMWYPFFKAQDNMLCAQEIEH